VCAQNLWAEGGSDPAPLSAAWKCLLLAWHISKGIHQKINPSCISDHIVDRRMAKATDLNANLLAGI